MNSTFRFLLIVAIVLPVEYAFGQWTPITDGIHYNSGNLVGIGTASPTGILHVVGSPSTPKWIYFSNNINAGGNPVNNPGLAFGWNKSGGQGESNIVYNTASGAAPHIAFSSFNGATFTTEMVLNAGKLGIGTSAPSYRLTVAAGDMKAYNFDSNSGVSIGAEATQRPRIGFHVSDNSRRFKIEMNNINTTNERLGFFTNNSGAWAETEVFSIGRTGKIGVGSTTARALLDVTPSTKNGILGTALARLPEGDANGDGTYLGVRGYATQQDEYSGKSFALEHAFYGSVNNSINFFRGNGVLGGFMTFNTNNNIEAMRLTTSGALAIGTTDPKTYKLAVAGKAIAEEVVVKLQGSWPDYVFESTYELIPLAEVEQFIRLNKHLPEVPTEKEIKENGIAIGEMNALLLKKVEELTLYVIELKKENEEIKKALKKN